MYLELIDFEVVVEETIPKELFFPLIEVFLKWLKLNATTFILYKLRVEILLRSRLNVELLQLLRPVKNLQTLLSINRILEFKDARNEFYQCLLVSLDLLNKTEISSIWPALDSHPLMYLE